MLPMSRAIETRAARRCAPGFTLIEILVAISLLAIIAMLVMGMADSVRKIYSQTSSKVQAYRGARRAMETLSATLSQAMLNPYLDYVDSRGFYRFVYLDGSQFVPARYVRTSELRFLSGNEIAGKASSSGTSRPTHSVFFQAPLGLVQSTSAYGGLNNLLNSLGFYIEFKDDSASRPDFFSNLSSPPPLTYRFRLMEAIQPSDKLSIYSYTDGNPDLKSGDSGGKLWITDTLASTTRLVADNIVALVVLPKLGANDQAAGNYSDGSLAPDYSYDSTATNSDPALNPKNQLPPLLEITLVAVDERSFARFQGSLSTPKDLGLDSLFLTVGDLKDPNNPGYAADIKRLKDTLTQNKIDYRVFTLTVPIKAARWSKGQKN